MKGKLSVLTLLGILLFILKYYMIFLSPMETILIIIDELESLESLVKLARKKRNKGLKTTNFIKVEGLHGIQRININKNCRNKTLHLMVEINNNLIEGLVETCASMLIMSIVIIRELGIMSLIFGSES